MFLVSRLRQENQEQREELKELKTMVTKAGPILCFVHPCNNTICPGSSDPFYIVSYYIKWVTISWTYCTSNNLSFTFISLVLNNCRVNCTSRCTAPRIPYGPTTRPRALRSVQETSPKNPPNIWAQHVMEIFADRGR